MGHNVELWQLDRRIAEFKHDEQGAVLTGVAQTTERYGQAFPPSG
jgi:hypothetical protein